MKITMANGVLDISEQEMFRLGIECQKDVKEFTTLLFGERKEVEGFKKGEKDGE